MSDVPLSKIAGGGSTTSVVHRYSASGKAPTSSINGGFSIRCKEVLTGSLTAGVLSSALLDISGSSGVLYDCALYTVDATSRTLRIQIVADGVTVFDSTTSAASATGSGFWATANGYITSTIIASLPPIKWNSTLTVKVASSVTETDKTTLAYSYATEA